ncbi:MAG: putative Pyruvate dehydrogenase component, subunit beta [Bacteroidetes bacterium]|nr:putative Pyruvate dehydrogenase component, subunit beta [Bacteroidota bacterium]
MTYIEAISKGMWEEMERDKSVFLIGEDIGAYGGAFKATKGFLQHFGEERVIDAPLSEAAIIGAATGAAVVGMRPIAEMQFADFVTCGFNQIVTNAAKTHYRWSLPVPMVVRLPSGGYIHGGPYHSSNPEGWFFHVPGLKIVAPSTPYDAKGLMKAAVRDNNPVLYFEYKYLYRRIKGDVPEGDYTVEIGKGEVKRQGSDIVVFTYGSTVHHSLEAAEIVAKEDGLETRVVDLRTLLPLDKELIINSVKSTGKVLIVHEDTLTGGIGAEVAALISEFAFQHLDAPIKRVASLDAPVPFAPPLEEYYLPDTNKIVRALRELGSF